MDVMGGSPTTGPRFDVFIAYRRNNAVEVLAICEQLRRCGINYWIDLEHVKPGDNWNDEARKVLQEVSVAAFFFGASGSGPWQYHELDFALEQCHRSNIRVIPVRLPGGEVPNKIGIVGRTGIEFSNDQADVAEFARLVWAITDQKPNPALGEYEIHIEIPSRSGATQPEKTCFIATSSHTPTAIATLITTLVKQVGGETLQATDSESSGYLPDVELAIRASSVLIADCSRVENSGQPDPTVMYQLGLANALGKHTVLVMDEKSPMPAFTVATANIGATANEVGDELISYRQEETGATGDFGQKLSRVLAAVYCDLRPPYLVRRGARGINVAFADVFRLRVAFWDKLDVIFSYGMSIDQVFRQLSKHAAKLEQALELGHMSSAPDILPTGKATLTAFRDAHEKFCEAHLTTIQTGTRPDYTLPGNLRTSFDVLLNNCNGEVKELLKTSCTFCELIAQAINGYFEAYNGVLSELERPHQNQFYRIPKLKADVACLVGCIEAVHDQVTGMLTVLVNLIARAERKTYAMGRKNLALPCRSQFREVEECHTKLSGAILTDGDAIISSPVAQQEFIDRVEELIAALSSCAKDISSTTEYELLSSIASDWQRIFSTTLGIPRDIRHDIGLGIPSKAIDVPMAQLAQQLPVLSEVDLELHLKSCAYHIGQTRKIFGLLQKLRRFSVHPQRVHDDLPSTPEEADQDWYDACLFLASDVLIGEKHLVLQIAPEALRFVEGVWLQDIKRMRAYLRWEQMGRQWTPQDTERHYLAVCSELHSQLVNPAMKMQVASFDGIARWIKTEYLPDGKINISPGTAAYQLVRRKAERIWQQSGCTDSDANWRDAERFVTQFYNHVIPAVCQKEATSIDALLHQFAKSCESNTQCEIVSAFETAIVAYFLDCESITHHLPVASYI